MARGLARSRGEARDLIAAGEVRVAGVTARKPAQAVSDEDPLTVDDLGPRWVGRAAHKLLAALHAWGPDGLQVHARRCIDVGASTGGFTQVLLAEGAARVVALDVGHGQLAAEVASDPRVDERSGTSVRGLAPDDVGGRAGVVVADLSFISLTLVADELAGLLDPEGDLVVLVKPQFEVGRRKLGQRGVVGDPRDRAAAVRGVAAALVAAGLSVRAVTTSPISGTTGNIEYLMWARSDPSDTMTEDEIDAAARAVAHETPGG